MGGADERAEGRKRARERRCVRSQNDCEQKRFGSRQDVSY